MTDNNGNGKPEKSFAIVPPKSPEEIAKEQIHKSLPELRRACSRDPRLVNCVGAKWLFGQLCDNSCLHKMGGDGWGRMYASVKDLRRYYGHSEEAISSWRDKLVDTGWIWIRNMWPKSCWGISAVCQQPELFAPHSEYTPIMAKASAQTQPLETGGIAQTDKTAISGHNTGISRADQPPLTCGASATDVRTNRYQRLHRPLETYGAEGQERADHPSVAAGPRDGSGYSAPSAPVTPSSASGHTGESPTENGSQGEPSLKRSTDLTALNRRGGARKINAENLFLLDVGAVMELWRKGSSKTELSGSGAWWRLAHRQNSNLAQRVLAETQRAVKESEIKQSPGQYAVDLWKRWGGKRVSETKT